jgi:hypothetical protein
MVTVSLLAWFNENYTLNVKNNAGINHGLFLGMKSLYLILMVITRLSKNNMTLRQDCGMTSA